MRTGGGGLFLRCRERPHSFPRLCVSYLSFVVLFFWVDVFLVSSVSYRSGCIG